MASKQKITHTVKTTRYEKKKPSNTHTCTACKGKGYVKDSKKS